MAGSCTAAHVTSEIFEDTRRRALRSWVDQFKVDLKAKLTFLSLPADLREAVRAMGTLTGHNLSAVLMQRIRQVYKGHVHLDPLAQAEWNAFRPVHVPKSAIVIVLRGESHREGNRLEHYTTGSINVFRRNVEAYMEHLILPLETAGHTVLCYADLRCAPLEQGAVAAVLHRILGKRVVESRIQEELLGFDQVSSIKSCWDFIMQAVGKRCQEHQVAGVYLVRADCLLKHNILSTWASQQKLTFLWRTYSREHGQAVNDITFWIPCTLFKEFRKTLEDAPERVSLHWLSKASLLAPHVALEFEFNHPSSTHRYGNPIYDLTCREVGPSDDGKFREYELQQQIGFQDRERHDTTDEEWECMIRHVMNTWYGTAESQLGGDSEQGPMCMDLSLFRTYWYKAYPHKYLPDFMPRSTLLGSLNQCTCVEATRSTLSWSPSTLYCNVRRPCDHCGRTWSCLPRFRCGTCESCFCILCFYDDSNFNVSVIHPWEAKRCSVCILAPWRKRRRIICV